VKRATARRYLLGQTGEKECARLEREYWLEPHARDLIASIEHDLIEEYIAGDLCPEERRRFEDHYLAAAAHRRRVEIVRGLIQLARRRAEPIY
jgi:hypothetical protein